LQNYPIAAGPSTSNAFNPAPTGNSFASQPAAAPQRYSIAAAPPATSGTGIYGDAAAAAPAPPSRDGDQYTVAPNDSYWTISQKTYGSGAFFKALYELNRKRMKDPDNLKVGQVLSVPDEATIRRLYPDLCPKPRKPAASTNQRMISASARSGGTGRVYTVVEGDTLFEIARHELGKPARWAEIYQLNHDILGDDFDYLRAGTELILPADAPNPAGPARNNTAIRQPEAFYPR
jgi:nucleoid-associated protein YgaU